MENAREWYVRTADGSVYGPADVASLVAWAEDGRIDATVSVSKDRVSWSPSQLMEELEMNWLVESEPGKIIGPFNRAFLVTSQSAGTLPPDVKLYRRHGLPVDQDPPPQVVERRVEVPVEKIVEKVVKVPVEKVVEKVVVKEVPVEKIVEKIVEVPVEKAVEKEVVREVPVERIVEKIVEKRVEVPVEKVVEKVVVKEVPVEKIVEKVVVKEVPVERIVEKIVEVPASVEVVEAEVVEPADAAPPPRSGGVFGGAGRSHLAALEEAARRELAAAGKKRFGFFGRK